jgi:flagellar biosynthesis/type III secretory pathway protein FliH
MHTLFAVLVFAAHGLPETNPNSAALQNARRALESQQDQTDSQAEDAARRRAAAFEAHQFEVHLAEFAHAWNDFVKEYSDKGTYNLKKAKLLSKALKNLQPHLPK